MLRRWLQARHDAKEQVRREARDLLTFMGDGAYAEARNRAREHRAKRDSRGDRHWSRVAVEIARRTGHVIGEKAADRYADAAESLTAKQPVPNRRAIVAELIEIAEAVRDLSRGKSGPMSLHNAEAAVHRLVAFAKSPLAEAAGRDLRAALADLASAPMESVRSIVSGVYPREAEKAGKALERLREIVLPAR